MGPSQLDRALYIAVAKKSSDIYYLNPTHQDLQFALNSFNSNTLKPPISVQSIGNIPYDLKFDFVVLNEVQITKTPSIFSEIKDLLAQKAVIVFSDIYRSEETNSIWGEIIRGDSCNHSLDFFESGWVFTEKNKARQHFKLHGPGKKRFQYFDY